MPPIDRFRTDPPNAAVAATAGQSSAVPTFLGILALDLVRGEPVLSLVIRCPACRGPHVHSWSVNEDGSPAFDPTHRQAHCWRPSSPYRGPCAGYLVAPADTGENRRAMERFVALVGRAPAGAN